MPAGRPLKYQPDEISNLIEDYFQACRINRMVMTLGPDAPFSDDDVAVAASFTDDCHPTITGMALALDTTRDLLCDYEERPEFSDTIKKAKTRVESYSEQRLFGNNVTGVIFSLKNNFGWVDKQENLNTNQGPNGGPEKLHWTVEYINASSPSKSET